MMATIVSSASPWNIEASAWNRHKIRLNSTTNYERFRAIRLVRGGEGAVSLEPVPFIGIWLLINC